MDLDLMDPIEVDGLYVCIYSPTYIEQGFHTRMQAQGLSGYTPNRLLPMGCCQIGSNPNRTQSQGVCVQESWRLIK